MRNIAYSVASRGPIPADLSEKIAEAHAAAVKGMKVGTPSTKAPAQEVGDRGTEPSIP